VDRSAIDGRFFETSYFLVPGRGGDHAYAVLREAVRKSGKVGVGKFVLRETQHLVAIDVVDRALLLTVMHFTPDLVDARDYRFPAAEKVRSKEVGMAESLIRSLTESWDPTRYVDEYQDNLRRVLEAKVKKAKPELEQAQPRRSAQVVDLMERLRQSLE